MIERVSPKGAASPGATIPADKGEATTERAKRGDETRGADNGDAMRGAGARIPALTAATARTTKTTAI